MSPRKRLPLDERKRAPCETSGVVTVGTIDAPNQLVEAKARLLQHYQLQLTPLEEKIAQGFVLCNNATQAYMDANPNYKGPRTSARHNAWEIINRPHVLVRIRALESEAAANVVIDYAAILDHDRAIVEGYRHADEVSWREYICCRYCNGIENKYQWRDFEEYLLAIQAAHVENARRVEMGKRELGLPSDNGGYGYDSRAEPNLFCPRCEGRGSALDCIADTTKLTGPAKVIVKGIRTTANGTEVLLHDIDKAKERLLRAGGYFDNSMDPKDIARAAAAGAGAGAAAAMAAAEAVKTMTADEALRLYLDMA
jgi:phage terminase small subunit